MVEVKITYETLFDLLRREKSRSELQVLDKTFYQDVISYLREKKATLREEDHHTLLFPKSEQEKIKIQIKNIQKILKELYEIREKKIINLALNKIRTESNLIDTSTLLAEELFLFDESCALLSKYKEGILNRVLTLENPEIPGSASIPRFHSAGESPHERKETPREKAPEKTSYEKNIPEQEDKTIFDAYKKEEQEKPSEKKSEGTVTVRILTELPKFLGQDKNIYGPYKKDETITIPSVLADVLIKKGRVEIV
ncbi:MAG: hypothetical protein ACP5N3_01455 [Candidatus Nanoarchaeia archaeon]